ncbi:FAD-dependent oxidoreductase [Massilia sp. B-10]|nr:FAD-dependent oxidoreductase [Massilia sp. B-10]
MPHATISPSSTTSIPPSMPPRVARIVTPRSLPEISAAVRAAGELGLPVAICGGRHAMGGQQFGEGALLLDMRHMNRVLAFDAVSGLVEVEAGIQWL